MLVVVDDAVVGAWVNQDKDDDEEAEDDEASNNSDNRNNSDKQPWAALRVVHDWTEIDLII